MQPDTQAEDSAAAAAAAQNGGEQEPSLPSRRSDLRQRLREKRQQARSSRQRGPGGGESGTGGSDWEGDVTPCPHEVAVSAFCQGPLLRPGVMAALAHLGGGVPLMQLMSGLLTMQPNAGSCAPGVVAAAAALLPAALQVATWAARDLQSLLQTPPASAPTGRRRSALKSTAGSRSLADGGVAPPDVQGAHEPGLSRIALNREGIVLSEHPRKGVGDGGEPDSLSTGAAHAAAHGAGDAHGAGGSPVGDGEPGGGCATAAAVSCEQRGTAGRRNAGEGPGGEGPKAAGEGAKRQRKQAEARLAAAKELFSVISFNALDAADQLVLWAAASPLDCAVAGSLLDLAEAAVQVPPTPLSPGGALPPWASRCTSSSFSRSRESQCCFRAWHRRPLRKSASGTLPSATQPSATVTRRRCWPPAWRSCRAGPWPSNVPI